MSNKNGILFGKFAIFFIWIMPVFLFFICNSLYGYLISDKTYSEYNSLPKNCKAGRLTKTVCYKEIDKLNIGDKERIILKFISYDLNYILLFAFLCTMSSFFYYGHKKS